MIKVGEYYIKPDFNEEYIKLYIKYITQDYIPCSTINKRGELVMSIVDKATFINFLKALQYCSKII